MVGYGYSFSIVFKKKIGTESQLQVTSGKGAMLGVGRGQDVEMQPGQRILSTEVVGLLWLDQNAGAEIHGVSLLI